MRDAQRARWSILTTPDHWRVVEHGDPDPLTVFQKKLEGRQTEGGCWIGFLSYDLGRIIEPTAQHSAGSRDDRHWPLLAFAHCSAVLAFDHITKTWAVRGDAGKAAEIIDRLEHAAAPGEEDIWRASMLCGSFSPDEYCVAVQRTIDAIGAGDIFQANITQRFSAEFSGSTRALARAAWAASEPRYGGYLEMPGGRCLISMSPELFLEVDAATRRVTTRPIKGTRPSAASSVALRDSGKDAAELHMITDLMRNDLGRVCEYGSVRVVTPRMIESHPTVHHGVSEVTGTLRPGERHQPGVIQPQLLIDLLRATFPPGSVTGAPKIRAMQIIDEFEPAKRGPYCGAIGMISPQGDMTLNVAIRTIALTGERPVNEGAMKWDRLDGVLDYGAGGGIVADSQPLQEYQECLDKTAVLRLALTRCGESRPSPAFAATAPAAAGR